MRFRRVLAGPTLSMMEEKSGAPPNPPLQLTGSWGYAPGARS